MRPFTQITTVTPADSYDLIDLATLKTLLGVTGTASDAFFGLLIPQASAAIANYCNRPFVVEAIQDNFYPARDGRPWVLRDDFSPLQLTHWPIVELTSVVETIEGVPTTLVSGTDFLEDDAKGQLTRLNAHGFPRNWRANPTVLVYSAGFEDIPADVVDAASRLIKGAYFAQSRDPQIRSQSSPGVYEAAYWFGNGPGGKSTLPPDVMALLDNGNHRVPVVG